MTASSIWRPRSGVGELGVADGAVVGAAAEVAGPEQAFEGVGGEVRVVEDQVAADELRRRCRIIEVSISQAWPTVLRGPSQSAASSGPAISQ